VSFDPTKLGSSFIYRDSAVVTNPNQPAVIVGANSYRVALHLQATANNAMLRPVQSADGTHGLFSSPTSAPLEFSMAKEGPLCQQQWTVFSNTQATIYVLETLWQPVAGE